MRKTLDMDYCLNVTKFQAFYRWGDRYTTAAAYTGQGPAFGGGLHIIAVKELSFLGDLLQMLQNTINNSNK